MTTPRTSTCGLDFGTSNSTLGIAGTGGPQLQPLEAGHLTIPSAIFFGAERHEAFLIGREANAAYVDGAQGRLMRSLKSILGSQLIDEKTQIPRHRISFKDVITRYVAELKARAERRVGQEITRVVHGRPVHFVDNDHDADRRAEQALAAIARAAGFREVSFQYEPVAAAFDFERQTSRECLALIADIGGGTSDFTVVRLAGQRQGKADRSSDILASDGIRLGGTDFDCYLGMESFMPHFGYGSLQKRGDIALPSAPFWDLCTWSSVHHLYETKRLSELKSIRYSAQKPELFNRLLKVVQGRLGHRVLLDVEHAKIVLSSEEVAASHLNWLEEGLNITSTRHRFENSTTRHFEKLRAVANACVAAAGLRANQIGALFFTGGTSLVPSVRRAIAMDFPSAEIIHGDQFGSVGLGLAIEAHRRYG